MMTTNNSLTRLDRMKIMRSAIEDCKYEHPEMNWGDMLQRAEDMVREEQRRLGYEAVYPIVDGCQHEAVYEGPSENCHTYVDIVIETYPEKKGQYIILPI